MDIDPVGEGLRLLEGAWGMLVEIHGGTVETVGGIDVFRTGRAGAIGNRAHVWESRPDPSATVGAILASDDRDLLLDVRTDLGEVRSAATAAGLVEGATLPLMALATSEARPAHRPADVVVRSARSDDMDAFRAVTQRAFGAPVEVAELFGPDEVLDVGRMAVFVGVIDGDVVATAMGWTDGDATMVFSIATDPALSGRGYGRAMTDVAMRSGGAALCLLQASAAGHPLYRSMGFVDVMRSVQSVRARG